MIDHSEFFPTQSESKLDTKESLISSLTLGRPRQLSLGTKQASPQVVTKSEIIEGNENKTFFFGRNV